MKITFILKSGGMITWDAPPDLDYLNLIGAIRRDGFFQSPDIHIRYDAVAAICHTRAEAQPFEVNMGKPN